jgi:CYTH domain-containing protein
MPKEIERKFLVYETDLSFLEGHQPAAITQGYMHEKGMTTRVRIVDGIYGFLTLKGPRTGFSRDEFEYPIPLKDAKELLAYCESRKVLKTRYDVLHGSHVWHVDIYHGLLEGLVTAEIELTREKEKFVKPYWASLEVTGDKSFSNKNLAITNRVPLKRVA